MCRLRGDEGQDGDVLVRLSFSELNRLQPTLNYAFHVFPFFRAGRNSPSIKYFSTRGVTTIDTRDYKQSWGGTLTVAAGKAEMGNET